MRFDEDELNNIYKDYRAESYKFDRGVFESAYASINDLLGKSAIEVAERVKNLSTLIHDYLDIKNLKTIIDYGGDSGQFIPRELLNSKCYLYDPSSSVPMENIIKIQEAAKLPHADFIMCCHTLEHVSYPLELLNAIATLLNPNGYIYIEVPLEVPDLPALSFDHISKYVHEHINAFTTKSIAALISNANIKLTPITIQIKKIKTESFGVTNIISVICQKSL